MKRVIGVSLALLMVLSAIALADGVGAFSAFKSGVGARALAMGGAFVAVANDATAVLWNPAGLAQVADTRIAGMTTDLYGLGITHQYVGAVTTFANLGIGLSWERAAVGGQEADEDGAPGGAFTWNESLILGTLAIAYMAIFRLDLVPLWDVLRNGTGGAEPETNTSIIDILSGAAGIVTWPAAGVAGERDKRGGRACRGDVSTFCDGPVESSRASS